VVQIGSNLSRAALSFRQTALAIVTPFLVRTIFSAAMRSAD